MKFTINIPEKISLNKIYSGIHWRKRAAQATAFHWAVHRARISAYSGAFPCHIEYRFKLHGKRLDSSNLAYMTKLLEDGMVQCGVIPDDSPKYVASTTMVTGVGDDVVEVTILPTSSLPNT